MLSPVFQSLGCCWDSTSPRGVVDYLPLLLLPALCLERYGMKHAGGSEVCKTVFSISIYYVFF